MNKKIIFFLFALIPFGLIYSKPKVEFITNPYNQILPNVIQEQIRFDANNIDTWIQNTGIFDQDIRTNNTPGFMWPKGQNRFAFFTAGLSIGTYIDGALRLASCSYKGEYAPGYINIQGGVPTPLTNTNFRLYKVTNDDSTSIDYVNWGNMIPYGAPYVDRNNNGQWDAGIDRPGIKNATQTIFICMTDGWPENHSSSEGFSGGTAPIFSEMHLTAWAIKGNNIYSDPFNDVQYLSFVVINKSTKSWNNTYFGFVVDPDLGDATDDYIGCDTTLNLAYCYNGDNMDGNGNAPSYGANPPSSGMDFFLSPGIYTGNQNDSIVFYNPPGSKNRQVKRGYKELGMTSFVYFTNTGSGGIVCEQDPSAPIEAYRYLTGIKKDGSYWFHPSTKQRVKKLFPGNPESGQGWSEYGWNGNPNLAVIKNCAGGDSTTAYLSPYGDRRFVFNSGADNFTVAPGDTQRVVMAQFIARGSNNKNSVTKIKDLCRSAQIVYDMNFENTFASLPVPVIEKSVTQLTISTCSINIYWNDTAEYYRFKDTIYHTPNENNIYSFEGYEVYEVSKYLPNDSLPDFGIPLTINLNVIKLLKIFDKVDTIGLVIDTLPIGNQLYAPLPIVPPYGFVYPSGFPNFGINRLIPITQTQFPQNYGGNSAIQYGQTYKFIVCAYAVSASSSVRRGFKVLRNPLNTVVFTITPQPYPNNITFSLHNGDTINTNRRDMAITPVVVNQSAIVNAKYKILFINKNASGGNDTTYNILRSFNQGASWDTLKKFLKWTNTFAQDSSRIIDGIYMEVKNIRYPQNEGVVKDPITSTPYVTNKDSIQARFRGWEYFRNGAPIEVFEGSKHFTATFPYQSKSMSLSYPKTGTFNNVKSQLRADQLRKVRIEFSDLSNGQYAYRYFDTSTVNDQYMIYRDSVKVPFKVFMVDSTDNNYMRQLNCAISVSNDINPALTGGFFPTADSLGNKLLVYVFNSTYDGCTATAPYKLRNLYLATFFDIMYVWAPKLKNASVSYAVGDMFNIYPYTLTRPFFSGTIPLWYEFSTTAPTVPVINISSEIPDKYDLMQNYPNPFNPETKIKFALPEKSFVTMKVYNILGQLVEILIDNKRLDIGTHIVSFNGNRLSSGVYFYVIETERFRQTKRMVLLK